MACDKILFSVVVYTALNMPAQTRPSVKWQQVQIAKSNKLMKPLSTYLFVSQFGICFASFIKDFTCLTGPVESLHTVPGPQEERSWWLMIAFSFHLCLFNTCQWSCISLVPGRENPSQH